MKQKADDILLSQKYVVFNKYLLSVYVWAVAEMFKKGDINSDQ